MILPQNLLRSDYHLKFALSTTFIEVFSGFKATHMAFFLRLQYCAGLQRPPKNGHRCADTALRHDKLLHTLGRHPANHRSTLAHPKEHITLSRMSAQQKKLAQTLEIGETLGQNL